MALEARSSNGEGGTASAEVMTLDETKRWLSTEFSSTRANKTGQKIRFVRIGPAESRALQSHCMFARQRDLREPNLRKLITGIQSDRFLNCNILWVCHRKDTGDFVIINGQHTLESFVQTESTFEMPVVLDPVPDESSVEERYGLFDMGAARTQVDILRMLDILVPISEPDEPVIYATPSQIKKSSEAMTWLSSGLESNFQVTGKYERANAIRSTWENEVGMFWRILGAKRDPELSINEAPIWSAFYKNISGGAFQAPFLASMLAFPEETSHLLDDLIEIAKSGGELTPEEEEDPKWQSINNLYALIMSDTSAFYGNRRAILVWRVCLYLSHARQGTTDAKRDERSKTRQKGYSCPEHSWELATGGLIPKPKFEHAPVDMRAARERRVSYQRERA